MRTLGSNNIVDNHTVSLVLVQNMYNQFKQVIPNHLQQFWDDSFEYLHNTSPYGDINEDWLTHVYGNRYGYHSSAVGILAEFISIAIIQDHFDEKDISMCTSKEQQCDDKVDLIGDDSEQKFQVKSIRIQQGMVTLEHRITIPEYITAIDIDDNKVFMIPTANYSEIIEEHPDTRSHGKNGTKTGWKFNAEILYELNELDSYCIKQLYVKPSIPLSIHEVDSII